MLCGTGRRVINPDIGHGLGGYGLGYPCEGIHDDLTVTALYVHDGDHGALLLSLDLIGMLPPLIDEIRTAAGAAAGLPAEQVFLTCTHTHRGPEVRERVPHAGMWPTCRADYNARLVTWAAEAAAEAKKDAEPCSLRYNAASVSENMNRRYTFPDRRTLNIPLNKQLAGLSTEYVDRELGMVAFRVDGSPNRYKAVITNYAAHPLCVGNASNLATADYQGVLRRTVEETFAGCRCLATTGAAGDLHPLMPESGFASAEAMGSTLGRIAIERMFDSAAIPDEERLRMAHVPIVLRVKDAATRAMLPRQEERDAKLDLCERGETEIRTAFGLLGIGPILFVGVPGELVAELGAAIKWSSPFVKTWILYQSTDNLGYICATNQYRWGGYEPTISVFAAGEGERLVQCVLESARGLLSSNPLALPTLP